MLAIIYDIHGNLPALEAVLDDARTARAERFWLGGDYALFGPFPAETVTRLEALSEATWIRGNGERWSAHPEDAERRVVFGHTHLQLVPLASAWNRADQSGERRDAG